MMRGERGTWWLLLGVVIVVVVMGRSSKGRRELREGYYRKWCPDAEAIVREVMKQAMMREGPRSGASVMRLQFHDCFVQGCDASLLLDDTESMAGEKLSLSNINSLRDYHLVDLAKSALEAACPGVVSCADIIVMASRDAVELSGGPRWDVRLGRLDSLSASRDLADSIMPSPRSNATSLLRLFAGLNLTAQDLVALSGSHSIGQARCFSVMFRLYNQSLSDSHMDPAFRDHLRLLCPETIDQNVTYGLDGTPVVFDNQYFKDIVAGRGFLNSDQTLYVFPETRPFVEAFSADQNAFFQAFVAGMLKMGDAQSDEPGQIRANCRVANAATRRRRPTHFSSASTTSI